MPLRLPKGKSPQGLRQQAAAFQAEVDELRAAIERQYPQLERKRRGEWVQDFERYLTGAQLLRTLRDVRNKRSWRGRADAAERLRVSLARR